MSSPSRTRISRMRPATLAATAESSPSTRPVSSTTLDGVDGAKNSRQTTTPTIARAATAMNGATFLLDAVWLEPDASAFCSSDISGLPSLPAPAGELSFGQCQRDLPCMEAGVGRSRLQHGETIAQGLFRKVFI